MLSDQDMYGSMYGFQPMSYNNADSLRPVRVPMPGQNGRPSHAQNGNDAPAATAATAANSKSAPPSGRSSEEANKQKKSLIAARKSQMTAASSSGGSSELTQASLFGPRLDHLETQVKGLLEGYKVLSESCTRVEEVVNSSWLTASVESDTVEFFSNSEDYEKVLREVPASVVKAKQTVSVTYPMVESVLEGKEVFLMKRRNVDSDTAEVYGSWIVVHAPGNDADTPDKSFVTKFRFS